MEKCRKAEILENCDYFYEEAGESGPDTRVFLDYFGFEHCIPRRSYGPHTRTDYVIHVVVDGKGMLDYRGKRWMIREGQMFILYPGEVTTYYADKDDPWYYCWIGFQGESAAKIVESIGFSSQTPVLSLKQSSHIEDVIRTMLAIKKVSLDGQLRRSAGLLDILSDLIQERTVRAESEKTVSTFSYSEYAVRYINNHFSEKIRIQDLAKHIGISRSYLVKLMRQETGMSPQEYLIETRMRRASDLLSRSNDPVRNIAAECGYEDALAFSKVFKSRFGVNPSDYRAHFRSAEETE